MESIPFATVKTLYASKLNKDEATAAKQLRARLRSNFSAIVAADPAQYGAKGSRKERANDKRPWGDIPATFARDVLGVTAPTKRTKVTTK